MQSIFHADSEPGSISHQSDQTLTSQMLTSIKMSSDRCRERLTQGSEALLLDLEDRVQVHTLTDHQLHLPDQSRMPQVSEV